MKYQEPHSDIYTIYTKSNCKYCTLTKEFLINENIIIINCDEYLENNKNNFLDFIKNLTDIEYKTFPIIFFDKKFIGGYSEILNYEKNKINSLNLQIVDF